MREASEMHTDTCKYLQIDFSIGQSWRKQRHGESGDLGAERLPQWARRQCEGP